MPQSATCHSPSRRTLVLSLAATLLTTVAVPAMAGPKEEMRAISLKFLALRTYHVTMESSDKRVPKTEMDFQAPNRYRMQTPMGTQYIIGDTMHMTVDGRTMRIPMPKGTMTQWRHTDVAFRNIDEAQIESLGTETLNGKLTRKYRMSQNVGNQPTTTLMWIGPDSYPIKLQTSGGNGKRANTVTIQYSRYNDPSIKIEPPK